MKEGVEMKFSPCRGERSHSYVAIIDKELANLEECYCEYLKTIKSN
jgi:hypothetical protein